jgi:hypothetical protein
MLQVLDPAKCPRYYIFYYSLDRILTVSFEFLTWSIESSTNTEVNLLDLVVFVTYLVWVSPRT